MLILCKPEETFNYFLIISENGRQYTALARPLILVCWRKDSYGIIMRILPSSGRSG